MNKSVAAYTDAEVLVAALLSAGYLAGLAPWLAVESARVDRSVCRHAKCPACNHEGLQPKPFYRLRPKSYRCLGLCRNCGHAEEI